MAKSISFELVSPERVVLKDEVDFVVLPAYEGQMGVLPGHAPLLCQLVEGELKIRKNDVFRFFAVSGGFAEVHPDRVEVFAEAAEMEKEIDAERARQALERAKKVITQAKSQEDLARAQAALRRALIRLRVTEGISRRHTVK